MTQSASIVRARSRVVIAALLFQAVACAASDKVDDPNGVAPPVSTGSASDSGGPDGGGDKGYASVPDSNDAASARGGTGGASPLDGGSTVTPPDAASDDGRVPPGPCAATQCDGHGTCSVGAQGPVCTCDEGFAAPDCRTRTPDYGRRLKIAENFADPDVIKFSDDRYVLTGTGSSVDFEFRESSDLIAWNRVGTYNPSAADPSFDYCFCWAPDLVRIDNTLYLYFSAHRGPNGATTCPPPSGSDVTTYRAVSPDGSLRFGAPELLYQGQGGAHSRPQSGCPAGGCGQAIRIDPTVYDGRLYYVFFDRGNNIASVSLTNPSDFRFHAGPVGWTLSAFEESINEAPELLERAGRFYLFFSAAWYNSQYATFYVTAGSTAQLTRDLPLKRLTTPVRRGNGSLIETHGHNSIVTRRGETFNVFHVGVFDGGGGLIRRDTYRQRLAWNADGSAISQNQVLVSWNALGGSNTYSLDLVLSNGSVIGPCIAVGRIGQQTSATFTGVCPDAADRLVHKAEVQAFRLYASTGGPFLQVGQTPYDGYSDTVSIAARVP